MFALPKFCEEYNQLLRVPSLPYVIPIAQIGLMGSVYCTIALALERFLAVCYPFLPRRHVYSTRTFIIPVISFSFLYNVPKFFELSVVYVQAGGGMANYGDNVTSAAAAAHMHASDDNGTLQATLLQSSISNLTGINSTSNSATAASESTTTFQLQLQPTELRRNPIYIQVYILWMNIIFQILGPFVVLGILNYKVYTRIKKFEQTLRDTLNAGGRSNAAAAAAADETTSFNGGLDGGSDENGLGKAGRGGRAGSMRWIRSASKNQLSTGYKFRSRKMNKTISGSGGAGALLNQNGARRRGATTDDNCCEEESSFQRQVSAAAGSDQTAMVVESDATKSALTHTSSNNAATVARSGAPLPRGGSSRHLSARGRRTQALRDERNSSIGSFSQQSSMIVRSRATQSKKKQASLTTPRKREVLLSRISIYIVFMFVICHSVRLIPNTFEMIFTDHENQDLPWPTWVARVTNVSHVLLTLVTSFNFFIYYFKHGSFCNRRGGAGGSSQRGGGANTSTQMQTTAHHNLHQHSLHPNNSNKKRSNAMANANDVIGKTTKAISLDLVEPSSWKNHGEQRHPQSLRGQRPGSIPANNDTINASSLLIRSSCEAISSCNNQSQQQSIFEL